MKTATCFTPVLFISFLNQLRNLKWVKTSLPSLHVHVEWHTQPLLLPEKTSILITEVAGYIGSHTTLQLLENGYNVVGLDNMSRGSQRALNVLSEFPNFTFEHVDLGSAASVDYVFEKHAISAVLHLAAHSFVAESVDKPSLYTENNEINTNILLNSVTKYAVSNFVFASSSAVYGNAQDFPITEDTPALPISPYGISKLAAEKNILARAADASQPVFRARILRYFNVVGADSKGRLGENPRPDLDKYGRLWTACMNVVFGRDPCINISKDKAYRDYVHVEDVARANIAALHNILQSSALPGENNSSSTQAVPIWNVATKEAVPTNMFISTAESVVGGMVRIPICPLKNTTYNEAEGAQASFVQGSAQRVKAATGWKPHITNLKEILATAWNYSKTRPKETAIVMFDTRPLNVDLNSSYVYWRLAAELNNHYAHRHGYDFIYIKPDSYNAFDSNPGEVNPESDGVNSVYKTRAECYLDIPSKNLTVGRGASWCKLIGVASIFEQGYSTVVFIDSDAFFKVNSPAIETLIDTMSDDTSGPGPLLWMPPNDPWEPMHPNGGMHVWKTTSPAAWKLLRQWWQIDVTPQENTYEQTAVWELVGTPSNMLGRKNLPAPAKMKECGVGLLNRLKYMRMRNLVHKSLPVLHPCSVFKNRREHLMLDELAKLSSRLTTAELLNTSRVLTVAESKRIQQRLAGQSDNVAC